MFFRISKEKQLFIIYKKFKLPSIRLYTWRLTKFFEMQFNLLKLAAYIPTDHYNILVSEMVLKLKRIIKITVKIISVEE